MTMRAFPAKGVFLWSLAIGVLALSASAHADVINIDVNASGSPTYSGRGAFLDRDGNSQSSPARTFWNGVVAPATATDPRGSGTLRLSDGTTDTGVSVYFNGFSTAVDVPNSPIVPTEAVALMRDGASSGGGASVTVAGLLPNASYLVVLYGRSPDPARPIGTNFTFGSRNEGAFVSTFLSVDGSEAQPGAVRLTSGRDYALVNAKSDADGRLTLQYFVGVLNGMQIVGSFDTETLFTDQTPAVASGFQDGVPYELGTRFTSTANGYVTAVKFWRPALLPDDEAPVARLYSATGAVLAEAAFPSLRFRPATGWQQLELPVPVRIDAGQEYVVSVATSGYYAIALQGAAQVVGNGAVKTTGPGAGVFGPVGTMPTNSFNDSHYFRDVVFVPLE